MTDNQLLHNGLKPCEANIPSVRFKNLKPIGYDDYMASLWNRRVVE